MSYDGLYACAKGWAVPAYSPEVLMIPPYDALMLPVLRHCAEKTWLMRDLIVRIADDLGLSQEERDVRMPSPTGRKPT